MTLEKQSDISISIRLIHWNAKGVRKQMSEINKEYEVAQEDAFLQETPQPVEDDLNAKKTKGNKSKKKKRIIIGVVLLAVILLIIAWSRRGGGETEEVTIMTEFSTRGSISSVIEGNGLAKAKDNDVLTVVTSGTVLDVFVQEGEYVEEGTMLYMIDSPAGDEAVDEAKRDVDGYENQLEELYEAKENLNVKAEFTGKLLKTADLDVGDYVSNGTELAVLVDDSQMRLKQYYSYAYENDIYVGQTAVISVPGVMQQIDGTVTEVVKVERISPEGGKLFCVEFLVNNPGTLIPELKATAVLYTDDEEMITPYEQGELAYKESKQIVAKVSGDIEVNNMRDYLKVSAGELLVRIGGNDNDNDIFEMEKNLEKAREDLKDAEENRDKLNPTAKIAGRVVGLNVSVGDEVSANTNILTIIDTSEIVVDAKIDERNLSYIQVGMPVEVDQWGNIAMGVVDFVSLEGSYENGMATFPAKILVENSEGILNSDVGITYRINASQSDDCIIVPNQCVKSVAHPESGETMSVVFIKTQSMPENAIVIDGTSLGVPETGYYAVPVKTGIADKFNVEITEGLEEDVEVFSQVIRQNEGMMW